MLRQFLAVAGVASLAYASFDYLENWPEKLGQKVIAYDAFVRPTCEDLATSDLKYTDGSIADAMLIGVQIKSMSDISDLKIRFQDIAWVKKWSISTTSLSQEEANSLVRNLPTGKTIDKFIFVPIPRLMADSKTILQFEGVVSQKFKCDEDWFHASAPNKNIAHLIKPDFYPIREWSIKGTDFNVYKYLFLASSVALLIALFRNHKSRKKNKARVAGSGKRRTR